MAFNVGNFVKNTAQSAVDKLVNDVVGKVTSGLPMASQLLASSSAQTLFNIGASYESVQALTSKKTDAIISGAADEFFALAGKEISKAAKINVSKLRRSAMEDINTFLNDINPATKIASKKRKDALEILSVV